MKIKSLSQKLAIILCILHGISVSSAFALQDAKEKNNLPVSQKGKIKQTELNSKIQASDTNKRISPYLRSSAEKTGDKKLINYLDTLEQGAVQNNQDYIKELNKLPPKQRVDQSFLLASSYLELGHPESAVKFFETVSPSMLKKASLESQASFNFNKSQALKLIGRAPEARKAMMLALKAAPEFSVASRQLLSQFNNSEPNPLLLYEFSSWVSELVEENNLFYAKEALEFAFSKKDWLGVSEAEQLLLPVLAYMNASSVDPDTYERTWSPKLNTWPEIADGESKHYIEMGVRYLNMIYLTPANEIDMRDLIGSPKVGMRGALFHLRLRSHVRYLLSQFLTVRAAQEALGGQMRGAMNFYNSARDLDRNNMVAASGLAELILEYGSDIDPDEVILNSLINRLFNEKGAAYRSEDWQSIFHYHVVLGTIYSKRKIWGQEYEARSAVFQWEHALEAHHRLNNGKSVPGIHSMLAQAYKEKKRPDLVLAQFHYLKAALQAFSVANLDMGKHYYCSGYDVRNGFSSRNKKAEDQIEITYGEIIC